MASEQLLHGMPLAVTRRALSNGFRWAVTFPAPLGAAAPPLLVSDLSPAHTLQSFHPSALATAAVASAEG